MKAKWVIAHALAMYFLGQVVWICASVQTGYAPIVWVVVPLLSAFLLGAQLTYLIRYIPLFKGSDR
jgi:hypothetical protein